MTVNSNTPGARLSIDIEPELRRKIEVAAARWDLPVRDHVVGILQRVLAEEERATDAVEGAAWAELSARAFARDWVSEEDRVYDNLP